MSFSRERELEIIASLEGHPHRLEAESHHYCEAVVLEIPVSQIGRVELDIAIVQKIQKLFHASTLITVVSFLTADEIPQAFSGGGDNYVFLLHPGLLKVLHTTIGNWRS